MFPMLGQSVHVVASKKWFEILSYYEISEDETSQALQLSR